MSMVDFFKAVSRRQEPDGENFFTIAVAYGYPTTTGWPKQFGTIFFCKP